MSIMLNTKEHHRMEMANEAHRRGCASCVFWDTTDVQAALPLEGYCRFYPPRKPNEGFPITNPSRWCSFWLPCEANDGGGD